QRGPSGYGASLTRLRLRKSCLGTLTECAEPEAARGCWPGWVAINITPTEIRDAKPRLRFRRRSGRQKTTIRPRPDNSGEHDPVPEHITSLECGKTHGL